MGQCWYVGGKGNNIELGYPVEVQPLPMLDAPHTAEPEPLYVPPESPVPDVRSKPSELEHALGEYGLATQALKACEDGVKAAQAQWKAKLERLNAVILGEV